MFFCGNSLLLKGLGVNLLTCAVASRGSLDVIDSLRLAGQLRKELSHCWCVSYYMSMLGGRTLRSLEPDQSGGQ
jgi:hypothetical protein